MRWAIIADIHGNLEALIAVKQELLKEEVTRIAFLGDVVGYGANPNECVELLSEFGAVTVAGNHDWAAVGLTSSAYFNPVARHAVVWTSEILTEDHRRWIEGLPLVGHEAEFTYVHGTPFEPEAWHYIFSLHDALESFQAFSEKICFVGHSHAPVAVKEQGGRVRAVDVRALKIEDDGRYIINVGSVGQPRDGNPMAAYGIFDCEENLFFLRRVPYDVEGAQRKILDAGLPRELAHRLGQGW